MLDPSAMRRMAAALSLGVSLAGAVLACGASRLPAPPYVAQPTEALQEVAYPPPPARVENVPAAPNGGAVWIDGEWSWQGSRWAWKRGRWVMPPANAMYSPWTSNRDAKGNLYVAEGKWRDARLRELPDPPPLAVSRTRGGGVTTPAGDTLPTSPNVPLDGSPAPGRGTIEGEGGAPETPSGATTRGTERTAAPVIPDAGGSSDAGLLDVGLDDTMRAPEAEPLGTRMAP